MSFLSVFALRSQGGDGPPSATNLISGNEPLWTQSMLWDQQVALYSGVGYKDNAFLSHLNPRDSPFVINGLDLTVLRLPLDGWEVVGVAAGDEIQYWRNLGTNSEFSLVASLRVQREWPEGWKTGLEWRGLDEKEVLDVTTREGTPISALVEGFGITALPSVRKDFQDGLWCQVEVPFTRWELAVPLDDYWDFGPVVTVGYHFGQRADLAASYGASYQLHEDWSALDSYGNPLPEHLEIFQHQTQLAWRQYWDSHQRLRTSTRLIFAYDEDNGSGYFNDYQYQIVQDLLWQTANWQVKGSAQQVYELYPVQPVGVLNGQHLNRNLLDLSLAVERRLFKHLKGFGKVEYQRVHSNYAGAAEDYWARTYSCGLRWEF